MSEETLVNCVVIGDIGVGKTSLIIRHVQDDFIWEPTGFESHCVVEKYDEKVIKLCIFDTTELESTRTEAYGYADVIFICFSVDSMASFANIREKWIPEIKKYCPNIPFIVVGTKIDLRTDQKAIDRLLAEDKLIIRTKQGEKLASELKAANFIETSALAGDNVQYLFRKAIQLSRERKNNTKIKQDSTSDEKSCATVLYSNVVVKYVYDVLCCNVCNKY